MRAASIRTAPRIGCVGLEMTNLLVVNGDLGVVSALSPHFNMSPHGARSVVGCCTQSGHDVATCVGAFGCQAHRPDIGGLAGRTAGRTADQPPHPADESTRRGMRKATEWPRPARGSLVGKSSKAARGFVAPRPVS